jgi:hypothetical protein
MCALNQPHTLLQRIFIEGDPILLAITGCVSVLHTLFDMLRHAPRPLCNLHPPPFLSRRLALSLTLLLQLQK